MSAQLQWMITRNTSSFVLKKRNIGQPFNTVNKPWHLVLSSFPFIARQCIMMFSPRSLRMMRTTLTLNIFVDIAAYFVYWSLKCEWRVTTMWPSSFAGASPPDQPTQLQVQLVGSQECHRYWVCQGQERICGRHEEEVQECKHLHFSHMLYQLIWLIYSDAFTKIAE